MLAHIVESAVGFTADFLFLGLADNRRVEDDISLYFSLFCRMRAGYYRKIENREGRSKLEE